jgi:hypothetical protein
MKMLNLIDEHAQETYRRVLRRLHSKTKLRLRSGNAVLHHKNVALFPAMSWPVQLFASESSVTDWGIPNGWTFITAVAAAK